MHGARRSRSPEGGQLLATGITGFSFVRAVARPEKRSSFTLRVQIRPESDSSSVIFMDEHGRDSLDYTFRRQRLALLETVTSCDCGSPQERGGYADAERTESYEFTPDGVMRRTVEVNGEESRGVGTGLIFHAIQKASTQISCLIDAFVDICLMSRIRCFTISGTQCVRLV